VATPSPATPAALPSAPDTSYRFWDKPFFGVGLGFSLGGYPLFPIWERSLPKTFADLGITEEIARAAHPDSSGRTDSVEVEFELTRPPYSYNLAFPLSVWLSRPLNQRTILSLYGEFSFMRKTLQAEFVADTFNNRVELIERIGVYVGTVGLTYEHALDTRFFSVDDVANTYLTLGFGISPLAYLNTGGSVKLSKGRRGDHLQPAIEQLLQRQADQARRLLDSHSDHGYALNWQAGVTTIKRYSPYSGLRLGLLYRGQWLSLPSTTKNDITVIDSGNDPETLSFVAHRMEIVLSLLRGHKNRAP
jgi:hypothetical protein